MAMLDMTRQDMSEVINNLNYSFDANVFILN